MDLHAAVREKSKKKQKEAEQQARLDGRLKMEYILGTIERKKEEIKELERKIVKERKEKLLNWQTAIKMLEFDIKSAEYTIERERNVELPKLLNDENEITRKSARELYNDEYLKKKMSEKKEEDRRLGKY
jgi:anti-sigma-K factor RskA